jgi:hypothetical protein
MRFLTYRGRCAARAAALIGVVVVALFAAGCSKAEPSVAAYVGNSKITQQQVDDAVEGAAANKITITDGERDALIKDSNLAGLLNVEKGRPVAYDVADQQIVSGKIGSAAYLAAVSDQQVTLNPRFGVLDPTQKTIITDQSASLAEPAPTQTP